jgi:hypothetical protein
VLAAQLLVKIVLDQVETLVEGVERACKLPLSGSHLLEGSVEREALTIPRVSEGPIGGVHVDSIFECAARRFIRTKPQNPSVVRRALAGGVIEGFLLDAGHLTPPWAAQCPKGR